MGALNSLVGKVELSLGHHILKRRRGEGRGGRSSRVGYVAQQEPKPAGVLSRRGAGSTDTGVSEARGPHRLTGVETGRCFSPVVRRFHKHRDIRAQRVSLLAGFPLRCREGNIAYEEPELVG